ANAIPKGGVIPAAIQAAIGAFTPADIKPMENVEIDLLIGPPMSAAIMTPIIRPNINPDVFPKLFNQLVNVSNNQEIGCSTMKTMDRPTIRIDTNGTTIN